MGTVDLIVAIRVTYGLCTHTHRENCRLSQMLDKLYLKIGSKCIYFIIYLVALTVILLIEAYWIHAGDLSQMKAASIYHVNFAPSDAQGLLNRLWRSIEAQVIRLWSGKIHDLPKIAVHRTKRIYGHTIPNCWYCIFTPDLSVVVCTGITHRHILLKRKSVPCSIEHGGVIRLLPWSY